MKKRYLIYTLALSLLLSPSVNAKIMPPSLNKKKITLKTGETYALKVKNKGKKAVKWSSTKKKTASVNKKGVVSAKRKGKAKILAKIGRKTLTCKVTVKKSVANNTQTNHSALSPKPGSKKIRLRPQPIIQSRQKLQSRMVSQRPHRLQSRMVSQKLRRRPNPHRPKNRTMTQRQPLTPIPS